MICSQNDIKFYNDFYLTNFNTLKIKAKAKMFYLPENDGEMVSLLKKFKAQKPIILGNGSNVLFSSLEIENPIIYTGNISEINFSGNKVEVQAGAKVQKLSKMALERGLSGFEFLIGIPASLGGVVVMNAGAHGQTVSDKFISAKVYDIENNKILTLTKDEMNFSYRHSILKEKNYAVLSAKFELEKKPTEEIKAKMDENVFFRKTKQPSLALPNAGSVFKNPVNCEFSAGALIDKCGFRGHKLNDVEVWENHCNFIVNRGNANSIDYTDLIFEVYSKVKEEFGVELTPEIVFVGEMTESEKEKWQTLKK